MSFIQTSIKQCAQHSGLFDVISGDERERKKGVQLRDKSHFFPLSPSFAHRLKVLFIVEFGTFFYTLFPARVHRHTTH